MTAMNGKRNFKISPIPIIVFALLMYLIGGYASLRDQPEKNKTHLFMSNSAGDVVMLHQSHASGSLYCADCHHDLLSADQRTPCAECHGDDVEEADYEHSDLTEIESHSCTLCHLFDETVEPANCAVCHPDETAESVEKGGCQVCHDDPDITPDLFTHDEYLEIEDHSCAGCHQPVLLTDVYHQHCNGCHLREDTPRFANAAGARCEICHLK
jgi:hypothetical protein